MRRDASGNLLPALAASYSISPDGLTYDFTLKKNIYFDDGKPITADDVVFTINKTEDAAIKSPVRADWADVTVKKISDSEVQFILKQPYAPFLNNATLGILPEHIWQSVSDDQFIFSNYNTQPVGDGPYRVKNIVKDGNGVPQSYTLVPSSHYSGEKPFISKIILDFYPDEGHAFSALEAGEIDSMVGLDPDDAAILASTSAPVHILTNPVPRLFGIFFNQNQNPVFADKAVRQALSLAVDRQEIVSKVLDGYGIAINSPIPQGTLASSSSSLSTSSNIALATSTLEKDGWKLGTDGVYTKTVNKKTQTLAFSITTANSSDLSAATDMVANEWRAIGAKVTVNILQYSDLQSAINSQIIRFAPIRPVCRHRTRSLCFLAFIAKKFSGPEHRRICQQFCGQRSIRMRGQPQVLRHNWPIYRHSRLYSIRMCQPSSFIRPILSTSYRTNCKA